MSKVCTKCGTEKDDEEFYVVEKMETGYHRRNPVCKSCVSEYGRKMYAENPAYKAKRQERAQKQRENPEHVEKNQKRGAAFYESLSGRAKTLFKGICRRASKYEDFDITLQWVEDKLVNGICEITRVPFDFQKHPIYVKNPFAPSVDRRDSSKGYTKDNVRVVLWQVNLMRGEMNDEEILDLCIKVTKGLSCESEMDMG